MFFPKEKEKLNKWYHYSGWKKKPTADASVTHIKLFCEKNFPHLKVSTKIQYEDDIWWVVYYKYNRK